MSVGILNKITGISRDKRRSTAFLIALIGFAAALFASVLIADKPFLLNFTYVGLAGLIGLWLFLTRQPYFLGFALALWFFSPFVRRLIDYETGFYNPSPYPLLAPLLVTGYCFLTILTYGSRLPFTHYRGFGLAILGVLFGVGAGAGRLGVVTLAEAVLAWMVPLFLGFHIIANSHLYTQYKNVLLNVLSVSVCLMGLYGVYQYFVMPPWDALWMSGAGMMSIGQPEPQQVRVFSTLNSPGPFGMVMAVSLLVLFAHRSNVSRLLTIPGYVGWMLAVVRASWIGWIVGLAIALVVTRGSVRRRLLSIVMVTAILAVPIVLTTDAIETRVVDRMESLTSVEDDGSFQGRLGQYSHLFTLVANNPLGRGVGTTYFDSGWVTVFYQLGLVGGVLYCIGLGLVLWDAWQTWRKPSDEFSRLALAAGSMYVFLMFAGSQQVGVSGALMWMLLALVVAHGIENNNTS
jgi:hypothetical protein